MTEAACVARGLEVDAMNKTILVTGPELDPSAAQLVTEQGYRTVHTPPYWKLID